MSDARSRDVSTGALLNATVSLVAERPGALIVPLVLLGAIGAVLGGHPVTFATLGDFDPTEPGFGFVSGVNSALVVVFRSVASLVAFVLWFVVFLATTRAAFMPLRGEGPAEFSLALSAVKPVLGAGVLTGIVAFALVVVGFFAVVPGLLLLTLFIPLSAVLVAEGSSFVTALRRSAEITKGARWSLLAIVLIGIVVHLALPAPVQTIGPVGDAAAGALQGAFEACFAVLAAVFYERRVGTGDPAPAPAPASSSATTGVPEAAREAAPAPERTRT